MADSDNLQDDGDMNTAFVDVGGRIMGMEESIAAEF